MGCGASQQAVVVPAVAQDAEAANKKGGQQAIQKQSSLRDNQVRKLALLLAEDPQFWQDEAFHDLATNGQPPHDARVLALLVDDEAEPRLRKAAVAVYLSDAVIEWGEDLLEPAYGMPPLGAAFGLMASIMGKVQKQQVNRHNCKLLQETVRSAALVLCTVLRQQSGADMRRLDKHLRGKINELAKVLLSIRSLLVNYSHSFGWVLMMSSARLDKARFEALHYAVEFLVQQLIGVMSNHQWSAPLCDYTSFMERVVSLMCELSSKKTMAQAVATLAHHSGACETVATLLRLDTDYVTQAFASALPAIAQSNAMRREAQVNEKKHLNEQRAVEAQAQFQAMKLAASQPRVHAHKTRAEAEAARLSRGASQELPGGDSVQGMPRTLDQDAASFKGMPGGAQGPGAASKVGDQELPDASVQIPGGIEAEASMAGVVQRSAGSTSSVRSRKSGGKAAGSKAVDGKAADGKVADGKATDQGKATDGKGEATATTATAGSKPEPETLAAAAADATTAEGTEETPKKKKKKKSSKSKKDKADAGAEAEAVAPRIPSAHVVASREEPAAASVFSGSFASLLPPIASKGLASSGKQQLHDLLASPGAAESALSDASPLTSPGEKKKKKKKKSKSKAEPDAISQAAAELDAAGTPTKPKSTLPPI